MNEREWSVVVGNPHRIGCIGSVKAFREDQATEAAMSKFGSEGPRQAGSPRNAIYEDEDFSVHAAN